MRHEREPQKAVPEPFANRLEPTEVRLGGTKMPNSQVPTNIVLSTEQSIIRKLLIGYNPRYISGLLESLTPKEALALSSVIPPSIFEPPDVDQKKHPWDMSHPLIQRAEDGWLRTPGPDDMLLYYETQNGNRFMRQRAEIREHPALYKIMGYTYPPNSLEREYQQGLAHAFVLGEVITDEEIAALPDPSIWPRQIARRWPELQRGKLARER